MKSSLPTSIALFALVACGKPAQAPESTSGITETSSKEDMPPPPAKESTLTTTAPATDNAAPAGPAGGVIKLAALKLTPKKGKAKSVELKEDGTVSIDGKPAATIKGDSVDSTGGTSMLTVGLDGSLVGNGVSPGYKFDGDDLVADGVKISVGDDGTIVSTAGTKKETLGKVEGGASAKRASLILAVLYLNVPKPLKKK